MTARQHHTGAGRLRRRLSIERPQASADGLGGRVERFVQVGAAWAAMEWSGGDEHWRFGRHEQRCFYRITMRWRPGLDAGHRLRDGDRVFELRSVGDPDGSRRRLVCLADEVRP